MPRRTSDARGVAQVLWERLQDRRACFDEEDAGACRIDCAELVAQRLSRSRPEPRELDAGWTSADDHEREQLALSASVLLTLGALERDQDAPPDAMASSSVLRPGAFGSQSRGRSRRARSGGDDQPVVVE